MSVLVFRSCSSINCFPMFLCKIVSLPMNESEFYYLSVICWLLVTGLLDFLVKAITKIEIENIYLCNSHSSYQRLRIYRMCNNLKWNMHCKNFMPLGKMDTLQWEFLFTTTSLFEPLIEQFDPGIIFIMESTSMAPVSSVQDQQHWNFNYSDHVQAMKVRRYVFYITILVPAYLGLWSACCKSGSHLANGDPPQK